MKKLIIFDFDGTLTSSNSWNLFNTYFGMTPEEDASLFKGYVNKEFGYTEWTEKIVQLIKSKNLCNIEAFESFVKTIKLRDGALELINICKEKGYVVVVLSGAIKQVVVATMKDLNVDNIVTTEELIFDEQGKLEAVIDNGDQMYAKAKKFEDLCSQYEVDKEEAVVVGDGGNDIEVFKRTKKGIQIGDYEPLKEFAWKHVESLSEIKELL